MLHPEPIEAVVQPLSRGHRRIFFSLLFLLFLAAVPAFVFYATGYRYDFFSPYSTITATGGIYLSVGADDGEVYIDEEPVRSMRIFRQAMYIQSLMPGMHRVHVQAPGLQTWVKELPVYPHIVTEAQSFLMPVTPQVRPITEFVTADGRAVYFGTASTTVPFAQASTTIPFVLSTSTATSSFVVNPEFEFVNTLFEEIASSTDSLLGRITNTVTNAFQFAPTSPATVTDTATSVASTTIEQGKMILLMRDGEVYAQHTGTERDIPYYFCVPQAGLASSSEIYGERVHESLATALAAVTPERVSETDAVGRVCRSEIRLDRQGQSIRYFNFLPQSVDHVVMHRPDGVFVVEIDDRSWQNTQQLYGASAEAVLVHNNRLYVREGDLYFELLTKIAP